MQDQQPPPFDIKRLIIGMALATAIVFGWQYGVRWLYKSQGWMLPEERARQEQQQQQQQQQQAATQRAAGATTQLAGTAPATGPVEATTSGPSGALRVAAGSAPFQFRPLGSDKAKDPTYAMQLSLDPTGAGVQQVVLNDFKRSVDDPRPYVFQQSYANHEAVSRPLATRWVNINGQHIDLGNLQWTLDDGASAESASYFVDVLGGDTPVARLRKSFRVFPRDTKDRPGSEGFEVAVDYTIENLSNAELKVRTAFNGPTLPPSEISRGPDRQVISGHRDGHQISVTSHIVESFKPEEPTKDLTTDNKNHPALWAGATSVYFDAIVLPSEPGGGINPASYLQSIKAEGLNIAKETEAPDRTIATVFETKELSIAPGGKATMALNAYFGPRWRKILNNGYYSVLPRAYDSTLVIASGMCAFCTFQWLINALVWMLNVFYWVWGGFSESWGGRGDWGMAIITLVAVVRLLLHPVTKRSQISMMKLGKMGPEMERLRKKHGDNKEELNKAIMEFHKSQGVSPYLGCLPMFLQMPIWIALWSALQSTFELRQAPFLWGWTWIHDLAKPDALISWTPIRLPFGIHFSSLNVLPILLGVVFFIQQKMQPKPPAMTPEQEQQQKMMQWMTLLFPLFLYGGPSGLNLYIMTSTIVGIVESKRIRDHIKEREEAEKAGKVIVDAKPTRASKRNRGDDEGLSRGRGAPAGPKAPAPQGWLARKIAELQEKAEQVKREAERKAR